MKLKMNEKALRQFIVTQITAKLDEYVENGGDIAVVLGDFEYVAGDEQQVKNAIRSLLGEEAVIVDVPPLQDVMLTSEKSVDETWEDLSEVIEEALDTAEKNDVLAVFNMTNFSDYHVARMLKERDPDAIKYVNELVEAWPGTKRSIAMAALGLFPNVGVYSTAASNFLSGKGGLDRAVKLINTLRSGHCPWWAHDFKAARIHKMFEADQLFVAARAGNTDARDYISKLFGIEVDHVEMFNEATGRDDLNESAVFAAMHRIMNGDEEVSVAVANQVILAYYKHDDNQ